MKKSEIIKNLLIGLDEIPIDVMQLTKKIGFKNYKKFEQALLYAYKINEL